METKCDSNKCIINTALHKTLNISCGGAIGCSLCVFLCFPCTLCLSCSTVPPSVHLWSPFNPLLARSDALAAHLPFISLFSHALFPQSSSPPFLIPLLRVPFVCFGSWKWVMSLLVLWQVVGFSYFFLPLIPPAPPLLTPPHSHPHFYCLTAIIGKRTKNKRKARLFFPPPPVCLFCHFTFVATHIHLCL